MAKKLGQHFLINKSKVRKIISSLEIESGDTLFEIGPGHGELTNELLDLSFKFLEETGKGIKIIAIEKDRKLAESLISKIYNLRINDIEIILGDALKIIPRITSDYKLKFANYKLVGNIPYYITGRLLRVIGELERKPKICAFTIQKEVAERIVAKPPKMNILAASVQFWAEPKIIDFIPKKYFRPIPKVDSTILRLNLKSETYNLKPKAYYRLIKILFKQPRKTLLNNLSAVLVKKEEIQEMLSCLRIPPNARPQNLGVKEVVGINEFLVAKGIVL
jgi:16S rRNA (adenine1518-N6/adenine1519-N6)-dimethyltransferase